MTWLLQKWFSKRQSQIDKTFVTKAVEDVLANLSVSQLIGAIELTKNLPDDKKTALVAILKCSGKLECYK